MKSIKITIHGLLLLHHQRSSGGGGSGVVVISALQLPEINRRSAVDLIVASASATTTSGMTSSLVTPQFAVANELPVSNNAVTLNSQNKKPFPLASFGLQIYNDDTAYKLTLTALEVGYRNFFASVLAGNQKDLLEQ